MATAIETSTQPTTPRPPANLVFASFIGAVYVVAVIVTVFYLLRSFWADSVSPELVGYGPFDLGLRSAVQLAALLGCWWLGSLIAGASPPKGLRGGIFLMISAAAAIFFISRRVGFWTEEMEAGKIITALIALVLVFLSGRFFLSPRGERAMVSLEEQGWFSTHTYKRALGQKVRRLTILGFLLIGGSGVYSLIYQGQFRENWSLSLPFDGGKFILIPNAQIVLPIILIGLTLWIAFRVVNMPIFAEFLIATEAEMNKVSWTTRKRLGQDTVVVLITTVLMTVFLLLVDVFWGWLLSRELVGVLPGPSVTKDAQVLDKPLDW